jgi:hypothetical protein
METDYILFGILGLIAAIEIYLLVRIVRKGGE